jgi:hypothetical protein
MISTSFVRSVRISKRSAFTLVAALASAVSASAAAISLNASDGFGASSFAAGTNWAGGAAPSAGNTYTVGTGLRLRTPADANSYTFGGDSLTIANGFSTGNMNGAATGDLNGFSYKGLGTTGVLTVNSLILAGGSINHLNGVGDVFVLAGNLSVTGDSIIRAKQGPINITASVSGSSDLYIGATDGGGVRTVTFSGANTFTGDIVTTTNTALFILGDTGSLAFTIGANGVNNSVSGTGSATFNGVFSIDTSGADATFGNTWNLTTAATKTFGGTFSVAGYADLGSGIWSNGQFEFSTATGTLMAIPEPATCVTLAGGVVFGAALALRRRRASLRA